MHWFGKMGSTLVVAVGCGLLFLSSVAVAQDSLTIDVNVDTGQAAIAEQDFLSVIANENESVRRQMLETLIAKEGIENAWGLFEPTLEMSYDREYENEQNDADEAATRDGRSTYKREENVASIGVNSLLPTGTNIELIHSFHDPSTSLQTSEQYGRQKRIKMGVAVTQPLLKNCGVDANLTQVRIAERQHKISEYRLDRARLIAVFRAGQAYYDMQLAQTRYAIEGKLLNLSKEVARIVNKQVDEGKVPTSAIFRSESSLARRKARFHTAERVLRRSSSSIRQMLVGTSLATNSEVRVSGTLPELNMDGVLVEKSPEQLLTSRPDYLAAKLEYELEKDRVNYADNQTLLDVKLKGEYGQTGLGRNWGTAYDALGEGYEYWTVGASVSVPLGGGISDESMLRAAQKRAKRTKLVLNNLAGVITDEIDTSRREVCSAFDEARGLFNVVRFQRKVLDDGDKLFKNGRIDRSELIVQEQEYLEARLILAEKLVEFKKAVLVLLLSEGRLLEDCQIEVERS